MNEGKQGLTLPESKTKEYKALHELGRYYISIGDYAQAQKCYEETAILAPDEAGPYVGLGVIALQQNHLDDAQIAFKVACRLDRKCSKAYAGLAMVWQKMGDYKEAFENYLKCLEVDPDNMTALLGLFQASCQMGSFAKIIYYLDLYLSVHPQDNSVKFSLAALYIKEGAFEKSKKLLIEILQSDLNNKDAAGLLEEVEHNLARTAQEKK